MKRQNTIALHEVKEFLRRGLGGGVENSGGFCVYVDREGKRQYVVDDENMKPVAFKELRGLRGARSGVSLRATQQG